jgi:vacuolar iron transporter family protein
MERDADGDVADGTPSANEDLTPDQIKRFTRYHDDEVQAAILYRGLADVDPDRSDILLELAEAEDRHAAYWRELLARNGAEVSPSARPLMRIRLLTAIGRRFGLERVLPWIIRKESQDADKYLEVPQAPEHMAAEEMMHGQRLARIGGVETVGRQIAIAEGRHRADIGGALRASVFGINDGLVSNFALVMGMAGATADPSVVAVAGVAGLFAGAFSMAAGEWISVRSQMELYEAEIEVERDEIERFPDEEREEFRLIYRAKGFSDDDARALADRLMADPDQALDTMVREELGIDPTNVGSRAAWVAGSSSFVAFAFGATIPVLPFLFSLDTGGLIASGLLSGSALGMVGALLGMLTGRNVAWSALRMMLIGGAAAAATFAIGSAFGVVLD